MADSIDFGIIPNIDPNRDYSQIDDPQHYRKLCEQFQCISVSDDIVNEWIPLAADVPSYLCSLQNEYQGIAHYGITLFCPESVQMLMSIIQKYAQNGTQDRDIGTLLALFDKAVAEKKFVICYGI